MFKKFKPTYMLDVIYHLTPEELAKHNIKAVLTDLDNTLIAWDNPNGTPELLQWFETLKEAGVPVVVVSNNNAERVAKAVSPFGLDFIAHAKKPLPKGMNEGVTKLGLPKENIVMVGDQVMTDVRAANGAGIRSILVKPLVATDEWKTKPNRFMEKHIMKYLKKRNPKMDWRGDLGE
ncbi:YqeG family HAD IIIA-type phosphatase [Vagococcus coleopterorum]|uniref:YqeG family HAD IIIA-type phosphatase n=1 Tax=Vagococcus coleopterorum TaxID=2714946 RepID=A0A6G8AN35_9ENTE|nr:YqeG family HAD IIIA-type phosphatase [Vagococcus coleopterorum]QIL46379.1 YqeG family HAD IIIA-type phosphatase [Vagococcus coleopterorum]